MVNSPRRPPLRATLRELWAYRELVTEFTRRILMVRYKNSVLGLVWSLITPLVLIGVITLITKYFLGQPIPNYSAYIFPVMFAWTFSNNAIPDMCISLLENSLLIRRSYFPRELLPISALLAALFHFLIGLVLSLGYLMLLRIFPQQVGWSVLLVLLIIPCHLCLLLGLGLITAVLNVIYEDIRFLVSVGLQIMFYALPVMYPIERVAAVEGQPWLLPAYLANPFAGLLVLYQKAMLPPLQSAGHPALPFSWPLLGQTWLVSLLVLWFGLWYFNRLKYVAVERL